MLSATNLGKIKNKNHATVINCKITKKGLQADVNKWIVYPETLGDLL